MSDDFHRTIMGKKFYEATVPRLVEQLERLNRNLENFIEAGKQKQDPLTVIDARRKKEDHDQARPRTEDRRVHGGAEEVQTDGGAVPQWRSGC